MEFKEKIKYVRKKLFMSQEEFALAMNVSVATVTRWETGKFFPNYRAQKNFNNICVEHDIIFEEMYGF